MESSYYFQAQTLFELRMFETEYYRVYLNAAWDPNKHSENMCISYWYNVFYLSMMNNKKRMTVFVFQLIRLYIF